MKRKLFISILCSLLFSLINSSNAQDQQKATGDLKKKSSVPHKKAQGKIADTNMHVVNDHVINATKVNTASSTPSERKISVDHLGVQSLKVVK